MKRHATLLLAGGVVLGLGVAWWSLARGNEETTVQAALMAYAASAPDLSRAEAVLANRCLAEHGVRALMAAEDQPSPWPFTGAAPGQPAPAEPDPPLLGDEAVALFGPPGGPVVSATDPGGKTLTASASGCLAEARNLIYGSIQGFVGLSSMRQWLTERWGEALDSALASRPVRSSLASWVDCAREHGWSGGVTPSDVYDLRAVPLLRDPPRASAWQDERYCRVSSDLMVRLAQALMADPPDVPLGVPTRFAEAVRAASERAAAALDG